VGIISGNVLDFTLNRILDFRRGGKVGPASYDMPIKAVYHVTPREGNLVARKVWEKGDGPLTLSTNGYYLAVTEEYYNFPLDTAGLVTVRSTYARLGVFTPITLIDPGFEGEIIIEFSASARITPDVYRVDPSEMFQLVLVETILPTSGYTGRYNGQRGLKLPDGASIEVREQ